MAWLLLKLPAVSLHPSSKGGVVIERGYMNGASHVEVGDDTLCPKFTALNL